ncbi:hypothetical protein Ctob_009367 [Chrysochromulina tobinii]|uniref:Uncharacterized protein n=1 Tax=Chrysochromulina tobinii TaxID=1460289 RepID=A0A0M0JIV1_9EUKA|nr:hypothetical protein Ctob_009367 [Chrysochromulina tobinii]|eukprot:KOO26420.1 hypothetical protein Ctob_009367 [Chrysochromulina sp. CCMP291]
MISLRKPQELFGAVRDAHREAAAQSAELATGISQGLETVYAATVKCFGQPDVIVMVPWAMPPTCVLTSATQRDEAAANGQRTAWCTLDALDGHIASFPVGAAFLRIAALTTVGAHGAQNAGTWASSRPMVRARTAHTLASTGPPLIAPEALERQRTAFFEQEAARGAEIRALLVAADPGTGELIAMADKVMTAADYRMELPFPVNGLPDFSSSSLRTLPFVERPLQLSTSWLARLPPQQVPPGFKPQPWQNILRGWARRACCASLNQTASRDFECYANGSSTQRRPEYICIGPGGAKELAHADGIGTYNALTIVWELDPATGLYDKLDFERPGRTHWVLNMLRQLLGEHEDHQLLSLIMHRILEGFAQLLDVFVRDEWLPKQTPELRTLLAERSATLGPRQARPFDTSGYTDELQTRRARAIADSEAAIGGRLTREQLESHNSFLVHVHEWLDFPMGTLKGLSAPLKLPGSPEQRATLSEHVRAQHRRIIELLQTRHAASFWSGVDEAARIGGSEDGAGFEAVIFAPRITSDACSDVEHPHICGVCNGLYFRFPLEGAWRRRHITLTEACGTILALTIFAKYFPRDELLVESDATASLATAAAAAVADDLIYIRRRAEQIGAFQEATRRAWLLHCKGWANALSDAGSRDKMSVMYSMAAAMGIRLREVPIPDDALAFMQDVLDNTAAPNGMVAEPT